MKKFEYEMEYLVWDIKKSGMSRSTFLCKEFDRMGKNGWEVVHIDDTGNGCFFVYFKRESNQTLTFDIWKHRNNIQYHPCHGGYIQVDDTNHEEIKSFGVKSLEEIWAQFQKEY